MLSGGSELNPRAYMIFYIIRYLQLYYYSYANSDASYMQTSWLSYAIRITEYVQVCDDDLDRPVD